MNKSTTLALFFAATFLQAGTYGLTFMLPRLFAEFGADEKVVGSLLMVTAIATLITAFYSGHITDRLGRMATLGMSGFAIAAGLFLFSRMTSISTSVVMASALLGFGWSLFYALGPIVLSDIIKADERVRYFTLLSVFIMAGFGLSPVLSAMLENAGFDIATAFTLVGMACVVSGSLFLLLRPRIRQLSELAAAGSAQNPPARSRLDLQTLKRITRSRGWLPVVMVCLGASVFAGMNNFQTVFADAKSLDYADYFLTYTITVIVCRLLMAGYQGGTAPYAVISVLQYIMAASIALFIFMDSQQTLYILVAVLFGIGYGASYPLLAAMTANDADTDLVPQTLQVFALSYFIGIFAFPLCAGWLITEASVTVLLVLITTLALIEATMAMRRYLSNRQATNPGTG